MNETTILVAINCTFFLYACLCAHHCKCIHLFLISFAPKKCSICSREIETSRINFFSLKNMCLVLLTSIQLYAISIFFWSLSVVQTWYFLLYIQTVGLMGLSQLAAMHVWEFNLHLKIFFWDIIYWEWKKVLRISL